MLQVENVSAGYNGIEALRDVSISVKSGEVVSVIGTVGAGKSALAKCISGLLRCRAGRIVFRGQDITNAPPHVITHLGISQVPERRRIFPQFTALENLKVGGYPLLSRGRKKEFETALEFAFTLFPVLAERRNQGASTLSGGEQQMLAIARALVAKPALLVLDEPTLGLAPKLVETLHDSLDLLNRQGLTMLVCEQNADFALNLANRGYVLEVGTVSMSGSSGELLSSAKLRAIYFGEGGE